MTRKIISAILSAMTALSLSAGAMAAGVGNISFDYEDTVYFEADGTAKLEIDTENGHSGNRSLKISQREKTTDGAKLALDAEEGETTYNASLWVMSPVECKVTAMLDQKKINSAKLPAKKWVKLSGKVKTAGEDGKTELKVYTINGTNDLYIDDVSVLPDGELNTTPLMPEGMNMLKNSDFETGELEPFEARGCTAEVSAQAAKDGKYGAKVTDRSESWNGLQVDIMNNLVADCQYKIEFDFRMDAAEDETEKYNISLEYSDQADTMTNYRGISTFEAKGGEWVHAEGTFTTSDYSLPLTKMVAYIQSESTQNGFSVDNFCLSYYVPEPAEPKVPLEEQTSLCEAYKDYFQIGLGWDPSDVTSGHTDYIKKHYNSLTPGNQMKPDATQAKKGVFTFKQADNMMEFAEENNMAVHGHVFVWHEQTPDWFTAGLSRDEALENMRTHIFTVAQHFGDRVQTWDVVNEAINNITDKNSISGILRDAPWKQAVGEDYILQAFKLAAEAAPNAKLYYNDFNLDEAKKADAVCTLVKYIRDNGGRIDGVGMQSHYTVNTSAKAVEESIEKFEALGLDIHISELDVGFTPANGTPTQEEYIRQAQKYAQLFQIYKRHSAVKRVTLWGSNDGTSWRKDTYPLLFDANYDPKEAYYAVLDPDGYLEEHPEEKKTFARANAIKGTPTIDGVEEDLWKDAPEYSTNIFLMAWQGASAKFKALWDEDYLYVFMHVKDSVLSDAAEDAYNQDSVEVFIDENNSKSAYYEDTGDAQYRVNYKNVQSFGTGAVTDGRFKTATKETSDGYDVELAIPLTTIKGAPNTVMGFDVQVNDDGKGNGDRNSVAKFNDATDLSWGNTENFGELAMYNTVSDIPAGGTSEADEDEIKVILNGEKMAFDTAPIIKNDVTLVPFRAILEALGAEVGWDEETRRVSASKEGTNITLTIDSTTAVVNGEEKTLLTAPEIVNDRTLIPLRFVSETLDMKVDWDGDTKTVTITNNN